MPENNKQNQNNPAKKKASLGRGLGSLLGGSGSGLGATSMDNSAAPDPVDAQSKVAFKTPEPMIIHVPAPQIPEESQLWSIPIDRLLPNTQQPRRTFTPDALRDLAASIKEKGILQPITARRLNERQFEIVAGERRFRAAQMAGLHEVPVLLKKMSEQDSLEYAIIENIQREDLNPMEEAEAYQHLIDDYSLTQQQVADKLGKERSSIANSLRLLGLPAELKVFVRNNELSTGHAKVLLALENPEQQLAIAKEIIAQKLSVRAAEKLVLRARNEAKSGAGATAAAGEAGVSTRLLDSLADDLQKLIGSKVAIDYSAGKGKLQVHFYSDDQLSQIVEKVRRAWEK